MKDKQSGGKRLHFNIIDVLVLLLLVAVVVILVTKIGAVTGQQSANTNSPSAAPVSGPSADFVPEFRFEAVATRLDNDLAAQLAADAKAANRLYNNYRLCNAYITEVTVTPSRMTVQNSDGTPVAVDDPLHSDVCFRVEASTVGEDQYASVDGNFNTFLGSYEIRVGKQYPLKTMTVELNTVIVSMEVLADD